MAEVSQKYMSDVKYEYVQIADAEEYLMNQNIKNEETGKIDAAIATKIVLDRCFAKEVSVKTAYIFFTHN